MPNLTPATDTGEAVAYLNELAGRDAHCEVVVPIGAVTKGRDGTELAELGMMAAQGVTMFSDDGACVHDSLIMRRALTYLKPFGVVAQHAQDPRLAGPSACCHESERISGRLGLPGWPTVAESTIIARDVQLAEFTGGRYHACHISTAESVEVIRWAKKRGIDVTAEVTPHHLLLDTPHVEGYDTTFKVNPPPRTSEHIEALRDAAGRYCRGKAGQDAADLSWRHCAGRTGAGGLLLAAENLWLLALWLMLFFVAFNILEATLPSLVSRTAPPAAKGAALGVYNTTQAIGLFVGGAGGGFIAQNLGDNAVFAICVLAVVWMAVAASMNFPQRRVAPTTPTV